MAVACPCGGHLTAIFKPTAGPVTHVAKHGRRGRGKRFRKYLRGNIDETAQLGTLGPATAILTVFDEVVTESTFISSAIVSVSLSNYTPGANRGPLLVLLAHSDYSLAEVEQFIETTQSWEVSDLVGQEISRRKIRRVGIFDNLATGITDAIAMNNGRPIRVKLGWMLSTGQTLNLVVYNTGSAALATSDPAVKMQGHANLWPR